MRFSLSAFAEKTCKSRKRLSCGHEGHSEAQVKDSRLCLSNLFLYISALRFKACFAICTDFTDRVY